MRRHLAGLVVGFVAAGVAFGSIIVIGAGAHLFRAALAVAAVFFAAGWLSRRGVAVALGGILPIAALAIAGIAFADRVWAGTLVACVAGFGLAGAAARVSLRGGHRVRAAAIAILPFAALVAGGGPLLSALTSANAVSRMSRSIEPFALVRADGDELRSADARGRVLVLAFWATWCEPCRAELPALEALVERYRAHPDVTVLWVNAGRDGDALADARAFATQHHVRLPLAFDRDRVADALGVGGLPAIAIVDRHGQLRVRHDGYDRSEPLVSLLADEIDRLVAED